MTARYDVAVIGAGPAGYAGAIRALDLGKRALLVERDRVGGAGIHAGALSSKTLWHLANDYAIARRADRGYRAEGIALSYKAVLEAVREAVAERRTCLEGQLVRLEGQGPRDGVGALSFVRGAARLVSPTSIEVTDADGTKRLFDAENVLVATGSTPRVPPGISIDGEHVLTSDHLEDLPDFPRSMVIVGAGVIGCEVATIFASFGRTDVRIIDRQPRILPFEDEDVAGVVADSFRALGVTIHGESKLERLARAGDEVSYELCDRDGTRCEPHRVERALVAIGRAPATRGLGLERIGVRLDAAGGMLVEGTRSTVPNVYGAGDVTMDVALANVAELEARHAIEKMFGLEPRPIRYEALSAIMFLAPEVASVGLNETQARAKKIPYRVGVVGHKLIHRSIAMRSTRGFVKLLASPDGKLLGLRCVGPQASSTVQGIAYLIDQGATLDDIDRCVHPHPAVTEGVQEAARLLLGRSIHKPTCFGPDVLRCGEG